MNRSKLTFTHLLFHSILHRYPVITSDPFPWEKAMYDMQEDIMARRRVVSAFSWYLSPSFARLIVCSSLQYMMDQLKGTDGAITPETGPVSHT